MAPHPHLPRQLQWSLEYWAAATHRRTAVIQSAAHGWSIVCVPTGSVFESRAARLCCCGSQDTAKTLPKFRSKPSDYMLLSDGETMTTVTRRKENEAPRTLHFPSGTTGCVRALHNTLLKAWARRELRPLSPAARASSRVEPSDTRALAANHAHTLELQ